MAMTKCEKGHIYDSAQGGCPICGKGASGFVMDDIPATGPVESGWTGGFVPGDGGRGGYADAINPYVPSDPVGMTQAVTTPGFTEGDFAGGRKVDLDDYDPTEAEPINGVSGFDPVVGWLVCVKGPNRGRDYRLHSGTNFIGRSKEMDVCIENDQTISKKNAASISYDDRSKTFFIQKGEVRNLLYLNGKPVRSDADIVAYDRLEIGSTELVFLPLCGENFDW